MRGSRGFSLIEVLAGLLILSFVITTSLGVFYHRESTHRRAEEMMLAWQVLGNETEIVRRIPWVDLGALHGQPFISDLELLAGLDDVSSTIEVTDSGSRLKDLALVLTWGDGRSASVSVLRSDTGGATLW